MTKKPIGVYFESDDVIADFKLGVKQSGKDELDFQYSAEAYLNLGIVPGAEESLRKIKELDDKNLLKVYILTDTPYKLPAVFTDKTLWYRRNFAWLEDRIIISQDKSLIGTEEDFLLDACPEQCNATKFRGTVIAFNYKTPETYWAKFTKLISQHVTSKSK